MQGTRIEVWDDNKCLLSVPGFCVPKDATLRECYETQTEIVVCGFPREDDENHNCDALGCSSVNHVLYRFPRPATRANNQHERTTHETV
jgi:hypothetical protein